MHKDPIGSDKREKMSPTQLWPPYTRLGVRSILHWTTGPQRTETSKSPIITIDVCAASVCVLDAVFSGAFYLFYHMVTLQMHELVLR